MLLVKCSNILSVRYLIFTYLIRFAVALVPLALIILIFYNFYQKKEFNRPIPNYIKNVRFIQMVMGISSDLVDLTYEYCDDFLYWKDPEKSIYLLKELIKLPLIILFNLQYLPIRYLIAIGLWVAALSNSPFFVSLFQICYQKVSFISFNDKIGFRVAS